MNMDISATFKKKDEEFNFLHLKFNCFLTSGFFNCSCNLQIDWSGVETANGLGQSSLIEDVELKAPNVTSVKDES